MPAVLVTGASRGLGLELARQYAADGWRVLAGARSPERATDLAALAAASGGLVTVHALDVADFAQIDALAAALGETAIDVLINCAGTMGRETFAARGMALQRFGQSDYEEWAEVMRVNLYAPMKMAEAFVPHLQRGTQKKLVTLTSAVGSMTQNTFGGLYAYRTSKAAANMLMKNLALDLKRHGIIAVPLHPGWVKTEIGGPRAELEVEDSVRGLRNVIASLTPAQSGHFLQWDGRELPW